MIEMLDRQRTYWQFAEPRLTSGAFDFSAELRPGHPPFRRALWWIGRTKLDSADCPEGPFSKNARRGAPPVNSRQP